MSSVVGELSCRSPSLSWSLLTGLTVMGEMLSTTVTEEIATREGVDPLQLDQPLYDVVDVGALETLVEGASERGDGSLEVQFTYYGYEVAVDGAGEVTVSSLSAVGDRDDATGQTRAGQ